MIRTNLQFSSLSTEYIKTKSDKTHYAYEEIILIVC